MKLAIIGTGNIGSGLAQAWTKKGHEVRFGVRNPDESPAGQVDTIVGVLRYSIPEAVSGSDVVVLAVPYGAVPDVARTVPDWRGRIVIDCTNAIGPGPSLTAGTDSSAAERNASLLPGALIVKSFNAQGAENLLTPMYGDIPATNFYCGDDASAKKVVRKLIEDIGFEPVDLGALRTARFLEPMTLVWMAATRALGSRRVAFKLLHQTGESGSQ